MTFIFDGNLEEFAMLFGATYEAFIGKEAAKVFMEAAGELDGRVKINISNGRYTFDAHMEGDVE